MEEMISASLTKTVLLSTMILLAAGLALAQDGPEYDVARRAVLAANEQFYVALNAMFTGDLAPMEAVWSHADEVTYLPPAPERLHGWEAVHNSWQLQADMKLGGKVEPQDVRVVMLSPAIALVVTTEVGENTNTPDGPQKVNIRSTKIFRLEAGAWKLFSDHADPLPDLANMTQ